MRKKKFTEKHLKKTYFPWNHSQGGGYVLKKILPSMVTVWALCMGLTALSFAFEKMWTYAAASVLIAGFLDGIDGPLARYFNTSTEFGAELDSLADFINFGVAPALISYVFCLQAWGRWGWSCCLFFATCCGLRLARFNIQRTRPSHLPPFFSIGVPAPAGAMIALMPLIFYFIFGYSFQAFHAFCLLLSGTLMISRYPTFVPKYLKIPKKFWRLTLWAGVIFVILALVIPWETLLGCTVLYLASLTVSGWYAQKSLKEVIQL